MSGDAVILFTREYDGLPFMTFTELEDGVTVSPFHTRYYQNGAELTGDALERTLGARHADGAPNSGTTTAELGFLYVLEAVLLALGFMFVRYFLSELGLTGKKR